MALSTPGGAFTLARSVGRAGAVRLGRGGCRRVGMAAMSWQQRLDKALLDVDAPPSQRLRNIRRVLEDPATVLQDVSRAVEAVASKGFGKGHVEAIDTLWPNGTTARKDLEALRALRKQVPEAIEELTRSDSRSFRMPEGSSPAASVQDVASGLFQLLADPKKRKEAAEEAKNAFRPKPRGLESPSYSVVRKDKGSMVQLRKYDPFTVAKTSMDTTPSGGEYFSGEGFMTLADYLFGKNSNSTAMAMTSPVEINRNADGAASMSFVLPQAYADAPPLPEAKDGIEIETIPERLVLVKAFPGVVTAGEVERQRASLSEVLESTWTDLRRVNESEYSVLQYNAPYTLPWRRLNEIAFVVEMEPQAQAEPELQAVADVGARSEEKVPDLEASLTDEGGIKDVSVEEPEPSA